MSDFQLHPRLAADTTVIAQWPLCDVLLMCDARYPWLILVPRRMASELHDLAPSDRAQLIEECTLAGERLKTLTGAAKINTAALGNMVPQLHLHVVARNPGDAAWPGPVWGQGVAEPYDPQALAALVETLRKELGTAVAL